MTAKLNQEKILKKQVRQQDACTTNDGSECNTISQRQHFRRSLYMYVSVSIYSTQGLENDISARFRTQLRPPVTLTWPPRLTVHVLTLGGDLFQFAFKSVNSFSKYGVHKLVTDKRTNKRTDRQTKGQVENIMRPTGLDWRLDYIYSIRSLSVLRSCVFIIWARSVRDN